MGGGGRVHLLGVHRHVLIQHLHWKVGHPALLASFNMLTSLDNLARSCTHVTTQLFLACFVHY